MFDLKLWGFGECAQCAKTIRHRYGFGFKHLNGFKFCPQNYGKLVRNARPTK